ncbi:type I secretion system permease/ATPase [Aphanothece hegewaldii CCALA 016]|uniref:Type I secretion system permease/ATPase n=1 Tax=Aphanothece hegewaldii CCALA 016 TaxID=2107694 RepID=A0A2T1M0B2_9CHRO|nr:peptidase domain-containing ABC transporter [Aphanothece hegewaldii]PSF38114.1 type I secretion system permease/ATPase [Aphanothece hegewaldii CCALA 016]
MRESFEITETTETIQDFLGNVFPFNSLDQATLFKLAEQMKPLRYSMGQTIMAQGKMSPYIVILYEGKARWLSYDPCQQTSVTLKILEPGAIIGCVNWARKQPCEAASASTEVVGLTLSYQAFLKLLEQHPQLATELFEQISILEVFDLLGYHLAQQAKVVKNLLKLTQEILPSTRILSVPANTRLKLKQSPLGDPNWVWLVSGGGQVLGFPIGSRFNPTTEEITLRVSDSEAIRFLAIPQEQWSRIVELQTEQNHNNNHQSNNKYLITEQAISAPNELLEDTSLSDFITHNPKNRINSAYISGKGSLKAAMACFQMISRYFNVSFSRETVRNILNKKLQLHGVISLDICELIAESMGLKTQLITVPSSNLRRLKLPGMMIKNEKLIILYEIGDQVVMIGQPGKGLTRRSTDEFFSGLNEEVQILLLSEMQKREKEPFGLRWFFPTLMRYRWKLIEVLLASFVVQILGLVFPLTIRFLIDKGDGSVANLNIIGFLLLGVAIFETLLTMARDNLLSDTTNRIDMSMGTNAINHLFHLPLNYFQRHPIGQITSRVNELEDVREFLTGQALRAIIDTALSIVLIAVLALLSPLLTVLVLAVIPLSIILTIAFSPATRQRLRYKAEQKSLVQSHLVETITGIETVKCQSLELPMRWRWQDNYADYISASVDAAEIASLSRTFNNFLQQLSRLMIVWVGFYLVFTGQLTLGTLIAIRIIAGQVTSPILRLSQIWQNFQKTTLSLERLGEFMNLPAEGEQDYDNIPMPVIKGTVSFEDVSFRHQSSGAFQLNKINLTIPMGTSVALVGGSGAGKSTLMDLLARLYKPEFGRIVIDGYDINKVELFSLRQQISIVPQETMLFEGSIKDNLSMTNPNATSEEIVRAAKIAVAHDFIMNLPNGYNTMIGEKGSTLSGGQRQRLVIARAILQQPRILVLDEATSALDYTTEQQILLNLQEIFTEQTIFYITHRLDTIKNADLIIVMKNGAVVEQGIHEELINLKGHYYGLNQRQESLA